MKPSFLLWICLFALCQTVSADPSSPTDLTIADVTSKGFRVFWHSSSGAEPLINVFSDPAGTTPVSSTTLTPFPLTPTDDLINSESVDRGLLSIGVSGLNPNTVYYFRAISRSLTDMTTSSSALQSVRTARQTGLLRSSSPFTAFANPVVRFQGITADGTQVDVSSVILASVPGARTPVATGVETGPLVWLDLNNLISDASGTALSVAGTEALTLRVMRGRGMMETFEFFVPTGDATATASDPRLTEEPLSAPIIRADPHGQNVARVFMEFPVEPGIYYDIESSDTLELPDWSEAESGLRSDNGRLFWEDNGSAGTPTAPKDAPKRFYRLTPTYPE